MWRTKIAKVQGSLAKTVVYPSVNTLKISNQDLTNTPPKVAKFEMETSTNSWELPFGLTEYLQRFESSRYNIRTSR